MARSEANNTRSEQQIKQALLYAGLTQAAFVLLQMVVFDGLSLFGSVLAGLCGLAPWAMKLRADRHLVASMAIASVATCSAFHLLLNFAFALVGQLPQ